MKKILSVMAAALLCTACTHENVQSDPASVVVNGDGTVTFNLRNDSARQVQVDVQFAGRHDMVKDPVTGLWSLTLGPAEPDIYPYCFVVDGVSVMAPDGQEYGHGYFPNEGFKNSLLDMTKGSRLDTLVNYNPNVPRGSIEYVQYYSEAIGAYNNAVVYLPSGYSSADQYPVFYLISGTTDTEEVYYKVGRVNYILDNLIANGQAKEMIVVMPYGNPAKLAGSTDMLGRMDLFGNDLMGELMPYIESHYSTLNDRDHRAIGGFSRGGNQALMNGLMNLDKFSYLCLYSSFTSKDLPRVYDNAAETNAKIHLFWSGVGTDDFLYGTARDYTEFLDQKGIRCVKEYTDNKFGHTWMNARYFLEKTLPLLFNPEASAQAMANAQPTKAKTGEEKDFTPGVMARLFPKPIVSPEIDGRMVTFRCKAPEARQVLVEGEMLKEPLAMERDSDGIWSATLEVEPEVYCYNFVVDGMKVCDAQNMYLADRWGFKPSILNMPDAPYMANQMRCDYLPVHYQEVWMGNEASETWCDVCPEDWAYQEAPEVLLMPREDDDISSWIKIGHANIIRDQMIAKGECQPFRLVVTFNQHDSDPEVIIKADDYATWAEARKALVEALRKTLPAEK